MHNMLTFKATYCIDTRVWQWRIQMTRAALPLVLSKKSVDSKTHQTGCNSSMGQKHWICITSFEQKKQWKQVWRKRDTWS